MNNPMHSVQDIKRKYKKYRFITIFFAVITIIAIVSAVTTGLRIAQLNNYQKENRARQKDETANATVLNSEIEALKKEAIAYQKQLASEKSRVKSLSAKIATIEKELQKPSNQPETESVPAVTAPAPPPEAETKAGDVSTEPKTSAPVAIDAAKPVSSELPATTEPIVKETIESTTAEDPQAPIHPMEPDTDPTPPPPSTRNEDPSSIEASDPAIETKNNPATPKTPSQQAPPIQNQPTAPATPPSDASDTGP